MAASTIWGRMGVCGVNGVAPWSVLQVSLLGVLVRVLDDMRSSLGAGNHWCSTSLDACFLLE